MIDQLPDPWHPALLGKPFKWRNMPVFPCWNPIDWPNEYCPLLGTNVVIEGVTYRVRGVEYHPLARQPKGTKIAIQVEEVK